MITLFPIFAYLDPGSGSALVGSLVALAGTALFSAKTLFFRLFRKGSQEREVKPDIAILSEGRNYWGTFHQLVEELISRNVHFAYYTLDLHDPALLIDSDYMHARLFDKDKAASFARLANIKAKIMLATTPNIGTPGYPLKRPAGVGKMAHVFHAFADISAYHVGSLDHYDIVLTVGPHQDKYIREVEGKRHLPAKRLVPVGLPYFDELVRARQTGRRLGAPGNRKTILVAPSWGAKGCLKEYGTGFILALAEAGYEVIVRPHPQSFLAEPDFIASCQRETEPFPNVRWDRETLGSKSMEASDVLISDTSSIRFDYAFLYGKPVITLDIPRTSQTEYEGVNQSEIWTDVVAPQLGRVVGKDAIGDLAGIVQSVLSSPATTDAIVALRDATVANLGFSASAIADFLVQEAA